MEKIPDYRKFRWPIRYIGTSLIYTDTGEKVDILKCTTEYVEKWKNAVYQKDTKNRFLILVWWGK